MVMHIEPTQEVVEAIGKTLHVLRPRGYCSQGQHNRAQTYLCWDEARAVVAAINGHTPLEYPDAGGVPATLAARESSKAEQREWDRRRSGKAPK